MEGVTFGDIFFILFVGAGIYLILSFVNRSRRPKAQEEAPPSVAVPDDDALRAILVEKGSVAVVGASPDSERPSHHVLDYLIRAGYTVFPVNPRVDSILGQAAYKTLADLPTKPDIVDVFRSPEHVPAIARQALARGATVLWLQEGVVSSEGLAIAREGGMEVVMDRCMLKEHRRLVAGDGS